MHKIVQKRIHGARGGKGLRFAVRGGAQEGTAVVGGGSGGFLPPLRRRMHYQRRHAPLRR